jgi:tetratricopeptide (TPR) repeat protein
VRWLILAVVLATGTVHADDKPWAANVSAQQQHDALDLYNAGNQLFDDGAYGKALEKYQAALAIWDHPKIHYNAAVCLINLDRTVEAYEQLQQALRYGAAPFDAAMYQQAQTYDHLLSGKVAELELQLTQDGAEVSLDGKVVLAEPGTKSLHVLASEPHKLVAEKQSYETQTKEIRLAPREKTTLVIELHLLPPKGHLVRRWAKWKPWAVLAGGGVVAIAGGALALEGYHDIKAYDDEVARLWNADMTAPPMPAKSFVDQKTSGVTLGHIGVPMAIAGGALAAAGFVMIVMNQPHVVTVAPAIGKEQTGISIVGRF